MESKQETRQEEFENVSESTDNLNTEGQDLEVEVDSNESENNSELEDAHKKLEESNDKYLRLYSEFENYKRRTNTQISSIRREANERLMLGLTSIADDFKKFIDNDSSEGGKIVFNKFVNFLTKEGLGVLEVKAGDKFDSDIHEALMNEPTDDESLKNTIKTVLEDGYALNDKIIRFPKVVVYN